MALSPSPDFRPSDDAFKNAIESGNLSENKNKKNYAGNFMYMYSSEMCNTDYFKNVNTREYIQVVY